jgi:cytochrome c
MDDRTNTIAGWVLAACAGALGLSIVSGMYFKPHHPEKEGFPLESADGPDTGGAAAEVPIATLLASADAAKGAEVFKKCAACHTINQGGANGIGPNLWGTMGEPIGQGKGGFAFSDALKGVGGTWDFDKMSAWLANPRKFAAGTKMTFAGLSNPQDRANLLVYLNSQGSNLPLPAAPAAADVPKDGAADAAGARPGDPGEGQKAVDSGELGNKAAVAPGAPSVDPNAAKEAEKRQ